MHATSFHRSIQWTHTILLLVCTACATKQQRPETPSPTIRTRPAPVAKPRAVRAANLPAVAHGQATYYADKFDGRRTASGIVFRNTELYAAHRVYPFGTRVRVTNLKNGRSVIVRIVDRGPNGTSERIRRTIIDLSKRAARELGFLQAGRTDVIVEVLEWGTSRGRERERERERTR